MALKSVDLSVAFIVSNMTLTLSVTSCLTLHALDANNFDINIVVQPFRTVSSLTDVLIQLVHILGMHTSMHMHYSQCLASIEMRSGHTLTDGTIFQL